MNGGSPPTAPNARAGLFTPPGITRQACWNASWLRGSENSGFESRGSRGVHVGSPCGKHSGKKGIRDPWPVGLNPFMKGHAPYIDYLAGMIVKRCS